MVAARALSVTLFGINGVIVEATADIADTGDAGDMGGRVAGSGFVGHRVGDETRDRVRAAVRNSDLMWPAEPVTLTVSPTVSPRVSPTAVAAVAPACDLAVACAVLAACGVVAAERLEQTVLLGELGLGGSVRPVRGVLPALLAARRHGISRAVVPVACVPEAAVVPGMQVLGVEHLSDVVAWLRDPNTGLHRVAPRIAAAEPTVDRPVDRPVGLDVPDLEVPDVVDVVGQPEGVHAVEVAAAGGHHVLLIGPEGSGATMLARRLSGLLPRLSEEQALQVAVIRSLAGALPSQAPLSMSPPFVSPHHSISPAALVGGGAGAAKPGAVTMAHHGLMFLDAAAEFGSNRLETLLAPLEEGEIRLARREGVVTFPARFQLLLATWPCPCGEPEQHCQCSPHAKRRYRSRLSGPLLDRIDLRVRLRSAPTHRRAGAVTSTSASVVRARVQQARQRAAQRWAALGAQTNAQVPAHVLRRTPFRLPSAVTAPLNDAVSRGAVTRRGADRTLRVSWTLADLAGLERPGPDQIAEALEFRDRRTT